MPVMIACDGCGAGETVQTYEVKPNLTVDGKAVTPETRQYVYLCDVCRPKAQTAASLTLCP